MDIEQAKQIIDTPFMIQVKYHGIPVYIQEINEEEETAIVFPLDDMEHVQEVDLEGLYEDNPVH
ncbi:H-type small acid-soluble spore protein [Bacillaceae bacterium W0354]